MTATANDLLIGPVVVAAAVDTIGVDFLVEDESWLEVYKSGSETPLILNTDYTFTGEGTDSGTVTLTVPADGVDSYSVYLIQPKERSSDLQFRGDFRSGPLNLELDRVWRAIQGIGTALDRTLRISKVSANVAPLDTETAIERALGTLAFSADGTEIIVGPSATQIVDATAATAASEAAAAADAAAAAAALSAADAAATAAAISAATALDTLLNYTGAWLTATAYAVNDLATENGSTYICIEAHTSGTFSTDLAASKWAVFALKGTAGAGTGDLVAANNLSDLASIDGALTNLGFSAFIKTLINDADQATALSTLGAAGVGTVLSLIDEDDFATNSATRPPSQQSVKAYVDASAGTGTDWEFVETIATTSGTTVEFPSAGTLADGYVYAIEMLEVEQGSGNNRELQLSLYGTTDAAYLGPVDLGAQANTEGIFGFMVLPDTLRVAMNAHQLPASNLAPSISSGVNFVANASRESESPVFHFATAQKVDKIRLGWDGSGSFDAGSMKLWRKAL